MPADIPFFSTVTSPLKMLSYEHSRYADHFRRDAVDIRDHGFDTIVHVLPEDDLMACPGLMAELFAATKDEGFTCLVDPLSVGNVFGQGRHSGLLQKYPEARRVTRDGTMDRICPSHPVFQRYLLHWIRFVAQSGADGILWDEPDLGSCRCGRCPPDAMWTTLELVTGVARAHGLWQSLCLHCMDFNPLRDGDRLDRVPDLAHIDDVGLSLVPASYANLTDGLGPYVSAWCDAATRVISCTTLSVWAQGYDLSAGQEDSVQRTLAIARQFGIENFGYWGYRGCAGTGVACDDPEAAWDNARCFAA